MLHAVWAYRGFVLGSVAREFRSRYGQAVLGSLWALIQPLAMIVVYTVIFAEVMRTRLPGNGSHFAYSIYLCAGILTWGLVADILGRAQTMFLDQASLLKKVSFPRICVPLIVVINALLNFGIIFGLFLLFLVFSGQFPGVVVLAVLPVLLIQVALAIGLGLIVGVLNVFFRDVGQLFQILVQFWFWLTPIVYPASILPPKVAYWLDFNPMTPLVKAQQAILVHGQAPDWSTLAGPALLAGVLCVFGLRLFRRRSAEMVDEL